MNGKIDFEMPAIVENSSGWIGAEDVKLRIVKEHDAHLLKVTVSDKIVTLSLDIINEKLKELV